MCKRTSGVVPVRTEHALCSNLCQSTSSRVEIQEKPSHVILTIIGLRSRQHAKKNAHNLPLQ